MSILHERERCSLGIFSDKNGELMELPCLLFYPVLTLGGLLVALGRIMLFLRLAKHGTVELAHGEGFHKIKGG